MKSTIYGNARFGTVLAFVTPRKQQGRSKEMGFVPRPKPGFKWKEPRKEYRA
jgi:hypothetical protein